MVTPVGWQAVAQRWVEHESGWGMRPDGWSLHVDEVQHRAYLAARAASPEGDEYDRPDGNPFTVVVDDVTHNALADSRFGWRIFDRASVPDGGFVLEPPEHAQDAAAYLDRLHAMYGSD